MGPYCRFCNQRCFAFFPMATPQAALDAYGPNVQIIATCAWGQEFEKSKTGWCYDDIERQIDIDAGIAPTALPAPATNGDRISAEPSDTQGASESGNQVHQTS